MPPKRRQTTSKRRRKNDSSDEAEEEEQDDSSVEVAPAPAPAKKPAKKGRSIRKEVKIAKDVDAVLKKCRQLKANLRKKAALESAQKKSSGKKNKDSEDSSEEDYSDDMLLLEEVDSKPNAIISSKPATISPSEIPSSGIIEVSELNATEVLEGLETIALRVTNQVLTKQGFSMAVPSRGPGNQIYVAEWDRIVLGNKHLSRNFLSVKDTRKTAVTVRVMQLLHAVLSKRIHITKRDLFYTDVKLFVNQMDSDGVLDDVATMIGCTRSNLHVVASDKGLVVGRIQFEEDGDYIDCTRMGVSGKAIAPYIDKIENIVSDAEFILLVEKEAAYMRLAEDRFYNKYPCIIITAKGQPDVATRMFLSRAASQLQIPVLGLVDSDPYGLKILSVYMSGSKNMSYDSASLTTPDIQWLGLRPSDLDKYNLPEQCRLDMTEFDIKTGKELLKEDFIVKNPKWMKEVAEMVKTKKKAEIQALSSFGFQYITEEYLPRKLREGDWI
ncbi:Meiotic recombination protein SPO11-1 [Seminavis robusta]|uniref:DNA topoisomerase (ATP-hydrolyzing) n=1 Tax=Seminavis robusta TaxID=568900 RepID=A0A9N8EGG6_9STRA|nr:Meiotic recombination protein SPO11-1 [Seminavis robusta]|eukprot:Sro1153_g247050.1 Meiotic recombination protein SPO11-1 (497) ;mRNA; f:22991-24597